jgi:hypothetical protein
MVAAVLLPALAVRTDREASAPAVPVTVPEMVAWFRARQQLVLPIAPPSGSPFLLRGHPKALPFDPDDFPLDMRRQLPGLVEYDCPVYPIVLVEDPATRATVILNLHGEPVLTVPPPADYYPYAYVQAKFPALRIGADPDAETAALLAQYDPARIQVAVNLIPADFYASYIAAEQTVSELQPLESGGGMEPLDGGGPFALTSIEYAGAHVELTFPGQSICYYVVESCADLGDAVWSPVDVLLWEDDDMAWTGPDDTGSQRFYRIKEILRANPQDQDNDGLDDVTELEVHHTDPVDADTDGDGLEDGDELLLQTDPLSADSDSDWASDGYEWEHDSDPNDPQETPMLGIRINDGAEYATSGTLSLAFPGLVADRVEASENDDFSGAMNCDPESTVVFSLASLEQGLRPLYGRAFRGDPPQEEESVIIGSVILDTEAPALAVAEPVDQSTTADPAVDVRGAVSDASSPIRVWVNQKPVHGVDHGAFWLAGYPLALGPNELTVVAVDAAGNELQQVLTVTRDPAGDSTPPAVDFNLPANPTRVGDIEFLDILGTADDPYASVQYTVTGVSGTTGPHAAHVVNGWLYTQIPLQPGANTVSVTAADAAGNQAPSQYTVIRSEGVDFHIDSPDYFHVQHGPILSVGGVAPTGFTAITANGALAGVSSHGGHLDFGANVPITPDLNLIRIRAVDSQDQIWYDQLIDENTSLRFRKYFPEGGSQLVVLHFEDMDYHRNPGEATEPDPSQITLFDSPGFWYAGDEIGFLVEIANGEEYTITRDAFTWPGFDYLLPHDPQSLAVTRQRGARLQYNEWGNDTIRVDLEKCPSYFVPKGGIEDNTVQITAKVTHASIKGRFKFTLESSNEPGYCLNGPLPLPPDGEDSVSWKDLQFPAQAGFAVSGIYNDVAETQSAGLSEAVVTVKAYDYGAFGKIRVEFLPADSATAVIGVEENGNKQYTTIPWDDEENTIWDQWWYVHEGGSEDDVDANPVGKGHSGDNLSRYEEYRGFVTDQGHLRTDPSKKTALICNKDGIDRVMVVIGPASLGYQPVVIDATMMTAEQVINPNSSNAKLRDMYAILLETYDPPGNEAGSTVGRIDTKAVCKVDLIIPYYWPEEHHEAWKRMIVAHEIGHALYLRPSVSGHAHISAKDCYMDVLNPYADPPPDNYCAQPGGDNYICHERHTIKGP